MGQCYIFGLQALAVASHVPPAFLQSASVFALATSAAKAGAVKANASPKATTIETSFVMGTSPPRYDHLCGGPQQLLVLRSFRAEANWRCVKNAYSFQIDSGLGLRMQ